MKMKTSKPFILVAASLLAVSSAVLLLNRLDKPLRIPLAPRHRIAAPNDDVTKTVAKLKDPDKERAYRNFVATHGSSRDKQVQEQVASARFNLGYLEAKRHDFRGARATFQEASLKYRGTGRLSPAFGGYKDGSDYQAAVCLVAEHKTEEAKEEFRSFLRKEPLSPLAKAAYRRLVRLNGGKSLPADEQLLQKALDKQQARAAVDVVSCGPNCVDYVLPLLGKSSPGVEKLVKFCETGKEGASIAGLRAALKHFGLDSYGVLLNARDYLMVPTPAIMLQVGHFTVLKEMHDGYATIYDPFMPPDARITNIGLPKANDSHFSAELLVFKRPDTSNFGSQTPVGTGFARHDKKGTDARGSTRAGRMPRT